MRCLPLKLQICDKRKGVVKYAFYMKLFIITMKNND